MSVSSGREKNCVVVMEIEDGSYTVLADGLTQDEAAQFCADASDEWEAENAPQGDDAYQAWVDAGNTSPIYWMSGEQAESAATISQQ